MARQITHQTDPQTGHLVQIVTPAELRAILDRDGEDYSRPAEFGPHDEWNVGENTKPSNPDHVALHDRLSGETWTDPAPTAASVRAYIVAGLNDGETVAYEVEGDDGSFFEGEATG